MIKANELRIGNWVDNGSNYLQIKYWMLDEEEVDYNPTPLTPEILEKCGFVKDDDGIFVFKKCIYWLDEGVLQIALNYAPLFNAPGKYLHQLQNLYFALTGEELNITL